jgi:hypothetical protein
MDIPDSDTRDSDIRAWVIQEWGLVVIQEWGLVVIQVFIEKATASFREAVFSFLAKKV